MVLPNGDAAEATDLGAVDGEESGCSSGLFYLVKNRVERKQGLGSQCRWKICFKPMNDLLTSNLPLRYWAHRE